MRFVFQAVIAALLFGSATPFAKTLLTDLGPNHLAGLLYLGAAVFVAPVVGWRHCHGAQVFPKDRRNRRGLLAAILFGGIIGPVLLMIGLQHALAASVSMWLNLETVATALLAVWLFKEHLGLWAWIGNLGVLAAGLLLGYHGGWGGWTGLLCVSGAAVAWGLDNNLTAAIDAISAEDTTFWKGLVAGSVNVAIGTALDPITPGWSWLWALIVGGFAYGISVSLYIRSAQGIGATRSQMMFSLAPFFGVLLSALWLGEAIGMWQVVAMGILMLSLSSIFIGRHDHAHHHPALEHEHEHRHDDDHHHHQHPDLPPGTTHVHRHRHEPLPHSHPHWPDIHHRHH